MRCVSNEKKIARDPDTRVNLGVFFGNGEDRIFVCKAVDLSHSREFMSSEYREVIGFSRGFFLKSKNSLCIWVILKK